MLMDMLLTLRIVDARRFTCATDLHRLPDIQEPGRRDGRQDKGITEMKCITKCQEMRVAAARATNPWGRTMVGIAGDSFQRMQAQW